jgi:probable HAF family extracellular repeat protein
MNYKPFLSCSVLSFAAICASGQGDRHRPHYTITDVGTLGGSFSAAFGVNDRGWTAGIASLAGDAATHAFLERSGNLTDLGTLGGPNSDVGFTPFRDDGTLTGDAETAETDPTGADFCFHGTQLICRPVVWHNKHMQILTTLGGNNGVANQINARGEIAGVAENTTFGPACFAPGNVLDAFGKVDFAGLGMMKP